MLVTDFDFALPPDLIAQTAAPRGESRMLVLDRSTGALGHRQIGSLPDFLRADDLLVVNNTRVFAARLLGHRVPSGGQVECLLLAPHVAAGASGGPPASGTQASGTQASGTQAPGIQAPGTQAPGTQAPGTQFWSSLMHPGQKLKPGALVKFEGPAGVLMARVLEQRFQGRRTIELWSESGGDIDALVDALGHVPLPPYIKRDDTPADRERYQTVFARVRGSVAAPTAGLHFTPGLLETLRTRGVEAVEITLHVGYGTFKPITVDRVEDHVVDPEPYTIEPEVAEAITRARAEGRRVIAVGTTTTRTLEDAAKRGDGRVRAGSAWAETFIYPGFEFNAIDGLITNFHLPKSSLLMLVAAFAGTDHVLAAYREAVAERYRFYSYGDAMLIV